MVTKESDRCFVPNKSIFQAYRSVNGVIELMKPQNEIELAMVRGILDGEGIPYIVRNDYFGSLLGGPIRYDYNEKTVMVEEENAERARELLAHIMEDTEEL